MKRTHRLFLVLAAVLGLVAPASAQNYGRGVAVGDGVVFVSEPANVVRSGIVYVYRADRGGRWVEAAKLTAPDARPADGFGAAIAAHGTMLLASRLDEAESRGAVHVFERRGDEWRHTARLTVPGAAAGDSLGMAIATDGRRALVASVHANGGGSAVHVFRRNDNGDWSYEATLAASDVQPDDAFGVALAISGDVAVVGAPVQSNRRGAAYLFRRDASGNWVQESKLVARTGGDGAMLGASVAIVGDRVAVGAPGRDQGTGAVFLFARSAQSGEWRDEVRMLPFAAGPRTQFGASLAVVGEELWIGAPLAEQFSGVIYRMAQDPATGEWTAARLLGRGEMPRGAALGLAIGAAGRVAAVTAPRDDNGAGTVAIYALDDSGAWSFRDRVWSEPESFPAVLGGQVECRDGKAAGFECHGVDLVAFLPVKDIGGKRGIELNDVWGWTDPETGREYALVGRTDGTAFIDITDPENPVYLGELPKTEASPVSVWRDIKVYANHAFIVADGAGPHGMQVFDLTRLRNVKNPPVTFTPDAHYTRINSAHNIVINEQTGFAYPVGASAGGETCGGGLHMIDIRDPKNPKFAGCFADPQTGRASTGYSHDAQCVVYHGPDSDYQGREICFGANETALSIADVTDKSNPKAIARASYPNVGYSHQGWLTEDHRFFYMNDELDELQGLVKNTRTLIWDVEDLDDPQLVGEFPGTTEASDHNLYIVGDTMYQSHYQAGLRVVDISNRQAPREVGYFDTVPYGTNTPGFGGSWSNYPFFRSGVIVVTSGTEGVFLVKVRRPSV